MKTLAVIPARGGSKRIPRKNIKLFSGRPMLDYAVSAAISSGLFEHVTVSSDDDEILAVAATLGAEPLRRPAELSDDHTPTVPVIAHAISAAESLWDRRADTVCCIYPAVPFLRRQDLYEAKELQARYGAQYVFPVVSFPSPIERALQRDKEGTLRPFFPQNTLTRTQDLGEAYYDAGEFYWGARELWLAQRPIHANGIGIVIPQWRAVDIDTPEDWERAELLHLALGGKVSAS